MQRVTQIPECKPRCRWARRERSISYHDAEWGTKQTDDRMLFELLVLEGAQAGLSRETILRKRAAYRAVFDGFDPSLVARFDDARVDALLGGAGIVRHRGTIESVAGNARACLVVQRGRVVRGVSLGFMDGAGGHARRQ